VTLLSAKALSEMPFLKSLPFESGSNLRGIEGCAFSGSQSFRSICLLPSVSAIDGSAFLWSSINEVRVDAASPHYFVSGPFLIGIDGMTLIRHFGDGKELGIDCLCDFGLRQIGPDTFRGCPLRSILIPASIEILGDWSFSDCRSLSEISFESGSKLAQMGISFFNAVRY
jgi:hypothetical protein